MPRKIIVTQYCSLDGVIEDPVGMEGSGLGNWTGPFSRGPEGDKFKIDELFAAESMITKPMDPAMLKRFLVRELQRWTALVEEAGLREK